MNELKDLNNRHLRIGRTPRMVALTRIRAALLKSAREFFDENRWLEVSPIPAISSLSGACEDFSTLFSLDYFGQRAFLIQTGQQHLEPFIYGAESKVFAFNQSYRAETQAPERRLTSFLLIEAEAANHTLENIQSVQEQLLHKMCHDVVAWREDDLAIFGAHLAKLKNVPLHLTKIHYRDAVRELNKLGHSILIGDDLKGEHEKALGEAIGQPFFVTHYPAKIKFFNMKTDIDDPDLVLSSDLLVPGYGEICGSSVREDDYDELVKKLKQFAANEKRQRDMHTLGIDRAEDLVDIFNWYLELRKARHVPHAGFGLGFERLVQWICGLDSIVEATEYPKTRAFLSP